MEKLSDCHNIGKKLEQRLFRVGIENPQKLEEIGSNDAFKMLLDLEGDTCFNTICALEGAVRGMRWHELDEKTKIDLRIFYDENKKL
ncbi:DNA transformation protein [Peptoclostridium litorale DSM 5388]|uniref:TfoX C-terminal domain-containing protein n=1 Tax=Peptoclostridium litorale DSM 5388 TaxID=1121324 RepID=A0A069RRC7_PEPLI|nr:TfoX/Sxy family DNA transformation protein [Peptoclostridium litorale]KDR96737.1 hypothetical protein CLIT_2c03430 [Peptoclostridium litorale DSM 5388]SIN67299.1 DNA transformation protein [Peptoclostridium litorale DSM 5388]